MVKAILKVLILLLILISIGVSFFATQLKKYAVVTSVDDGAVIQTHRFTPLLKFSVYNIKVENEELDPLNDDESDEFLSAPRSIERKVQYPIFPSLYDSYSTYRDAYSSGNGNEVKLSAIPSIIEDKIIVKYDFINLKNDEILIPVLLFSEYSVEFFTGQLSINTQSCDIDIKHNGELYEQKDKELIFKMLTKDQTKLTFEISTQCEY